MNLDVLLEDLEAQGYFQSKTPTQFEQEQPCKLVRAELEFSSHLLSSPLLGSDFLAGFEMQQNTLRWLIIPAKNIQVIHSADSGSGLIEAQLNLADLLDLKLFERKVKIIAAQRSVVGQIYAVSENYLQVRGETHSWIPLPSLGVVVVEKFSDLT